MLETAIYWLRQHGHHVEPASGIPGLYSVDRGPELTTGQVTSLWMSESGSMPRRGWIDGREETDAEFRERLLGLKRP